ncbi:hypothetical protein OROMI_014035 [Orobanche minor]
MAKRSKRRSSRHEKDRAGCISGIINVFHFRNGRSTKRLPADRKQVSKQAAADTEESSMPMDDLAKPSVKELMDEEMFDEQGSKQPNDSEAGSELKPGDHIKKHQKTKRSSAKSNDMDLDRVSEQKLSYDNLDLERILEELANINETNRNSLKHDVDIDIDEEKLVQAVKLFIERRISKSKCFREERNNCCSQELMDALNTLSLNKGSYLKLLQDPNSEIFNHIQNSEDARLGRVSEEKPANLKSDQLCGRKNRNFFRRRSKSLESYPLGENNKDCQSPNEIVILKPGLTGPKSPQTDIMDNSNKLQNERNTYQFSFTEIKRKLRYAMGKESRGVSPTKFSPKPANDYNGEKGENSGWSSPNRNHFYTERFTLSSSPSFKKGEPVGKLKDDCLENLRRGRSNIYIEAKKHLSEMMKGGDGNTKYMSGNNSAKHLGRILSLPEYTSSPCLSPGKHGDDIFITAQTRLSPRDTLEDNTSPRMRNLESQQCIFRSDSEDKVRYSNVNVNSSLGDDRKYSLEIQCFNNDNNIVSEVQSAGIEQTTELMSQEEEKIIDRRSINSIGGDIQNEDNREVDNEESASSCVKSHLSEDQISSSSTMSASHDRASTEYEDSDCAINKIEQPSPMSVLEPLFTDDDISPASTISNPVGKDIQPRHIRFEEEQSSINDQGICTRISLEDEESAFEYVEAVLLGSGLNWDEFLLRWISLYEILDRSLFEEVELFSSRPRYDQKLLFDTANEALKEVCESYFGCFPNVKPSTRRVPKGMDLIYEVWGVVELLLFRNLQCHSLDHVVRSDLAGSKSWMNIRSDIEFVVYDMEEMIFDELVEEIVLSFGYDNSEC